MPVDIGKGKQEKGVLLDDFDPAFKILETGDYNAPRGMGERICRK